MTRDEVLKELEAHGTAQNRKIYQRHGVGENFYGVSFADLKTLQKRIKNDQALSLALWETGNHDARMLATMIADPKRMDGAWLDGWVNDLDNYVITDSFAGLASQTAFSKEKMELWTRSDWEWVGRAGWHLLAHLAMKEKDLPDAYFEKYLKLIEAGIHSRKNRVRDAMNNAMIAIGVRNPHLEQEALATAGRIGKVEVDHGQTNCKTPDATNYIRRTLQRKSYAFSMT